MPPPMHTKPENVLKRAQELIAVGQSPAALTVLYEHVTSKRSRNSAIASLEPVMLLFVELCVQLKKGKLAKDGLYQYKNTAQNTSVATIELVLRTFIELSETKVQEAQARAEEVQAGAQTTTNDATDGEAKGSSNVEDLENLETPESILLSTVSGEQAKDRTDRAIVTPWLKFLWEAYRTVLEILKNNARLEIMYQSTALQAFGFCLKYTRKTEFRRLCELLRNHVTNAVKYHSQVHAINLNDPDTLQRHLDTRFQQLNVAVDLELWQEAFRSVEDIHMLLSQSKRPAKNIMMANYYEKLTRIFMVSDNWLFHAASWSRYYNLLRQSANLLATGQGSKKDNPVASEADLTRAASSVLLSALAIPVISTSRSRGALMDADEARKSKTQRLTNLLGMSTSPSRAILFKDAHSKGLLKRVKPEIRDLYHILEVDFHPLSICKKIGPILTQIGADPEMAKYIAPLQQVVLTRLFQQLSQVYESVQLSFVHELAQFPDPFQISSDAIEKFIMNGCKKGDLAIRLDHSSGVLTFDSDVFSSARALHPGSGAGSAENDASSVQRLQSTPAEIVRSQLTRLAKTLWITCQYVDPTFNAARQQAKQLAFERAAAGAEEEHEATLARRAIIEKKREIASDALQKKQKEDETRKRIQAQQQQEREAARLAEERRARELRHFQEEQKRAKQETLIKEIEELKKHKNIDLGSMDMDELNSDRLRLIRIEQMAKEKNELHHTLRITGKRIDHLERAFRKEELKLLPKDFEAQRQRDLEAYERQKDETLQEAKEKHKADVALKHRLHRLVQTYETFRKDLQERRHEEFEKRRRQADRELENAIQKRKRDAREARARAQRERQEEERRQREEEQRRAREEEARAAAEAEKKQKEAEDRERREKDRRERDEAAARQRQREEEAEQRAAARKASARVPGATAATGTARPEQAEQRLPERPAGAPRLNLGGKQPSWREREAAKEAAAKAGPPASSGAPGESASGATGSANPTTNGGQPVDGAESTAAPQPAKTDRFVPPHLRPGRTGSPSVPPRDSSSPAADGPPRMPRPPRPADDGPRRPDAAAPEGQNSSGNEPTLPTATPGKYVPRHLRNRQ